MRNTATRSILWTFTVYAVTACVISDTTLVADEFPPEQYVFESGDGGYPRYRIPALLTAPDGSLLAFCEGRKDGRGLTGNIDLILRRSTDNGRTWGPIQRIADDDDNTLGNPCPVIDESTGTIWLGFTRSLGSDLENQIVDGTSQERTRVLITHSTDSGKTWARPIDLTDRLRRKDWAWYGTGPGIGVQLANGRLVIPSYHSVMPSGDYESHMIYSDDPGESWQLGGTVGGNTSECHVGQRSDGTLYVTARTLRHTQLRTTAVSSDHGESWSMPALASRIYDPPCQGSLLVVPGGARRVHKAKPVWLYTHPAGPGRHNLTVRVSYDEGRSWSHGRQISTGDNQYSSMTLMPNGRIGCLFESWRNNNYQILFTQFDLNWLLGTEPRSPDVVDTLPQVKVHSVRKIAGDGDDHNAFTDLCRFRGRYYLTFRKCPIGHGIYPSSSIVIMASDDGHKWEQVHTFSVLDRDTRDPHFLEFRDRLFVYTGTWDCRPAVKNRFEVNDHLGFASWSADGKTWSDPEMLEGTHGHYIWRAATDGKKAYLCGRRKRHFARTDTRPDRDRLMECAILVSDDGLNWKYHGMMQPEYGNETAFRFQPDGSILGVARVGGGRPAQVIRAQSPWTTFQSVDLDRPIGGPLLADWNGHTLVGGRNTLAGKRVCTLYWLVNDTLHQVVELPSGGDTSYPGFVQLNDRRALVSYYSSHEGFPTQEGKEPPSSIFIAELELIDGDSAQ